MKKIFILILTLIISLDMINAQYCYSYSDDRNSITIRKEKKVITYDRYWKIDHAGEFGALLHANYLFLGGIDVGALGYYKFGGILNGDFGLCAGLDYMSSINNYNNCTNASIRAIDFRVGVTAGRHLAMGAVIGGINSDNTRRTDYGAFVTVLLPLRDRCFGFNIDACWTREMGFGLGAGVMFRIPCGVSD